MTEIVADIVKKIKSESLSHVARQRNFSLMVLYGARNNIKYSIKYFLDDEDIRRIDSLFNDLEEKVRSRYSEAKKAHKSANNN